MTAWLPIIAAGLQILLMAWKTIFSEAAQAKAKNQAYQIDRAKILDAFSRAIQTMQTQASQDSAAAGSVEDQLDQAEKGKKV